ncbi:hypothetical protein NZ698_10185 [Chryseobacterium sp. PBS4-4]|uniref:Glycine-rich domain-containing protein-like n=1 Tax=Chryseobacterium edaphi TaxID=2976532 RepID=A0ABT2W5W1_9FLAO|nr:hypothetical protein [Chryseobacterium edaphi]MCU7617566.1 hypothetical protein [Chryseobacterium edaphi]
MKTEIVLRNENLWQRIQGFSLDAQNASFPFSKKLEQEENWTADFTKKAIEEYKKFVYLCCISPNGASPSEIVDKVWHMHLIYTQNYWEDFCPNVLKMNLHHHPSKGGFEEKSKHQNWFSETLENYKEIFQKEAPDEIWKYQNKKSSGSRFWNFGFKFFLLILAFSLLNSCSNETGSAMITFGIVAVIIFFVFGIAGALFGDSTNLDKKNKSDGSSDGGSCGGGGSSCSGGSCGGGGCGGGCGGCGGS